MQHERVDGRGSLSELIQSVNAGEAESARQLIGVSLVFGKSGASVLRHFLDSVILFLLGRALLILLERIGMSGDQLQLIHHVSTWYETAIFVSFAAFSCVEIWHAKYQELRRMGAAPR